jgi:hypothetical protein
MRCARAIVARDPAVVALQGVQPIPQLARSGSL